MSEVLALRPEAVLEHRTEIVVPASVDDLTESMTALGNGLMLAGWATAATVYAWTRPASRGRPWPVNGEKSPFMNVSDFAALGIRGLTTRNSVRAYLEAWSYAIEHYGAAEVGPGDVVTLPKQDFPPRPDAGDVAVREKYHGIFTAEAQIEEAFAYYRRTGFPYHRLPVFECMAEINALASSEDSSLGGTITGYHVADTYHPHRFHASAAGMLSPFAAFQRDDLLRRALRLLVEYEETLDPAQVVRKLTIVAGVQATSNFRPGAALEMYRRYCEPGAVVLDSSSGYGGRLVGWMALGHGDRYIGIDPSARSSDGNRRMAEDLRFGGRVVQIEKPVEEVGRSEVGTIDFAFTSPPYFLKERYAEGDSDADRQSWARYSDPSAWVEGFLVPMLRLQFSVLRPGAFSVVNIADVSLDGSTYPTTEWLVQAAHGIGFEVCRLSADLRLQARFGAGQVDEIAVEPFFELRKPA